VDDIVRINSSFFMGNMPAYVCRAETLLWMYGTEPLV
jgi:hypothetical protein